jgi:hypothetical protein
MSHIQFEGEQRDSLPYFRPVSDGSIVRKISKEEYERRINANAKDNVRAREWSTPKESGVAYEEFYSALNGRIVAIKFREHETFGKSIAVTLRQKSGAEGIFTVGTDSQYGMSFMERLPSVDLEQDVRISAYAKEVGESKRYSIFVTQGDTRVESFFKSYDVESKTWTLSHGYPEVDEKQKAKIGQKYWSQRYFPDCAIFLVEYIEENVAPKVNSMVEVVYEVVPVDPEDTEF